MAARPKPSIARYYLKRFPVRRNRVSPIWRPSSASSRTVGGTPPRRFCSARHVTNGERSGHRCQRRRQMGHRGRGHDTSSCAAWPGPHRARSFDRGMRQHPLEKRSAAASFRSERRRSLPVFWLAPTSIWWRCALTPRPLSGSPWHSITPPMTASTSRSPKPKGSDL